MAATTEVKEYRFRCQDTNFVLIDTPGFDDTNISDPVILQSITEWLTRLYLDGQKLNGIIYLHRITDPRMQGSASRNFSMFRQLCGPDFYKQVILGTTFWSTMSRIPNGSAIGQQRVDELVRTSGFWGFMVQKGSEVWRIPEERHAARNLLLKFSALDSAILQIQDEVVNRGIQQSCTSVAKTVKDINIENERAANARAKKAAEEMYAQKLRTIQKEGDEDERRLQAKQHERLQDQEREWQRLEREHKLMEEERARQEENARLEMERLAREQADMEKKLEKLRKEAEIRELSVKVMNWQKQCQKLIMKLSTGIACGSVRCKLNTNVEGLGLCNCCLSTLTGAGHHSESR